FPGSTTTCAEHRGARGPGSRPSAPPAPACYKIVSAPCATGAGTPFSASFPGRTRRTTVSASFDFDLLCLGSGPAGQRAAVQGAKFGRRTAVVEKGRILGGVCLDTGTIPSKTFREAVLATLAGGLHDSQFGHVPEHRPTIDQLFSRVTEVVRRECDVIHHQLE